MFVRGFRPARTTRATTLKPVAGSSAFMICPPTRKSIASFIVPGVARMAWCRYQEVRITDLDTKTHTRYLVRSVIQAQGFRRGSACGKRTMRGFTVGLGWFLDGGGGPDS